MNEELAKGEQVFPDGWIHARFGDVATLQRGFDLPVQDRAPGSFPVIGSNGIVGFHNEPKVPSPRVIIGRSGTIGKSFYTEGAYWPLNTGLYVKDFHGNDPLFLHFFFHVFDFGKYSAGVSVPTLNRNLVHEAIVCIPPLPEQRTIAAVLSKIQAAVGVQDKIIVTLKELKAATMAKLFREGLRGQSVPHRETRFGEVPVNWNTAPLSEYAHVQTGVAKGRRIDNSLTIERPYLRVANVQDGYLDRKDLFNWKDEEPGNFERKVKRFFARERFLKLLSNWIIFFKKDDELRKIVLRQHQTRAVEKVVERALDPVKCTGLVWHTQGSGKTFTMIAAAEQILAHSAFEKPTVIMLVDRNELESQLFGNLKAYGLGYEQATSKARLRELLRADYRGLIVSMIHKFDRADANLCSRANVFVLVDEAHRTTSGDLGNYLVAALPNATVIGFTGTPIDQIAYGKGTFKVFGKDDEKGYLDKYSIAESIADGTTLPLHYTLAPNDICVPREQLEKEFLDLVEAEGVSDIEELNKILDRAVNLKAFLKAAHRVEQVAQFVADHFRTNVEPLGYKAFLVGVDREACALYKNALDKHLPPDYSAVVYTSVHNDSALLAEYRLSEDEEKKIRKAFLKRDSLPKILIVTEKLLTGFDVPILYCMYLDKPMRDHTLLQAIARVNRPYEEEGEIKKPAGFVVDFVGIFEKLEKALAFDSDIVGSVIQNLDVLKQHFATLMTEQAPSYLALCQGPSDDKAVERAINAFVDTEQRQAFHQFYKELEALYEIISPDVFLREYLDDYSVLSTLHQIVRNAFSKQVALYKDIAKKTESLVRERVESYGLATTLPLIKIDEKTLAALKGKGSSDAAKILNLGKSLVRTVAEEGEQQPYLIPIGERAEMILESYDDRQISTQEALRELEKLLSEFVQARKEREKAGFDLNTFTIYWVLKQAGIPEPEQIAPALDATFRRFPYYKHNATALRQLKAELYKMFLPAIGKERMVELVERILRLQRKS